MTPTTRAALLALLASAAAAGCLSSPSGGGSGPADVPRSTSFDLDLGSVPAGADWVALAIDPGRNEVVTAVAAIDVAFPSGVDPEPSRACYLLSLNGTGPFAPVVTAERADPTAAGLVNGQTVAAHQQGQGGTVTVVTTGVAGEVQEIHAAHAVKGEPMLLLLGAPRDSAWRPGSISVHLEASKPFTYRVAGSGAMACLGGYGDLPEGELAQGPGFVHGSGLAWRAPFASGMAAWVHAEADLGLDAALLDPAGQPLWEAHAAPLSGSRAPAFACGASPGEWTLSVPDVSGSSNRAAHLEALLVDLPPSLQAGFNCSGEPHAIG